MGRVSLACFHQFLLREKPSSFTNFDEAVRILPLLVHDIQKLEASIALNSLSLQWCTDVVNLLRKLHFHLLCFVQKCKATMLGGAVNCIQEYMKASLILLDICNSIKSAISEMNRCCLVIDVAAEKLSTEPPSKHEIERLERESKKLQGVEKGKILNSSNLVMSKTKSKDVNVRVVFAVKSTIRTLSLLLFSTIYHPVPIKVDDGLYRNFPQLKFFSVSVKNLICSSNEISPVLVENKMVKSNVFQIEDLQQQASRRQIGIDEDKFLMSIDLLKNNSKALKDGLALFESVVIELFEEVIKGRNKVLAMITLLLIKAFGN